MKLIRSLLLFSISGSLVIAGVLYCRGLGDRLGADADEMVVPVRDTMRVSALEPGCASCSLTVEQVITVGSPRDPEIPQRVPDAAVDSRGYVYLYFDGWVNKPILRYDSAGRYLGVLGKYGRGPGEYTMTFGVSTTAGDSVLVYADASITVFDRDGTYSRIISGVRRKPVGLASGPDGPLWLIGVNRTRGRADTAFAVRASRTGVALDSFPIFAASTGAGNPILGADGSLWTHTSANYRFERHSSDGATEQLLGVVVDSNRPPPAFTSAEADSIISSAQLLRASGGMVIMANGRPPMPVSALMAAVSGGVMVDAEGLIWALRNVRAPNADSIKVVREFLAPEEAPGEATIPQYQVDLLSNAVVEVFDPRRAMLVARIQLPFKGQLAAPGYVARVTQDSLGNYVTEVHRLQLIRP